MPGVYRGRGNAAGVNCGLAVGQGVEKGGELVRTPSLSPIVGQVECRWLYGRRRIVIPWEWHDGTPMGRYVSQVTLDVEGVNALCKVARKNKQRSARRGPVSVRQMRGWWPPREETR